MGRLKATVSPEPFLREVLAKTPTGSGEIPFAIDAKGAIYSPDPADARRIRDLNLAAGMGGPSGEAGPGADWVVVTRQDPTTGLVLGLAHPVGESLREIGRASARNLAAGMGLALLALLGILPLSHRMTRNLSDLALGAERLAAGELDVRVPVRSGDEFGSLARTFNAMAGHLKENQRRLLEQERLRKELEMCRKIQTELLPRGPLVARFAEIQGVSIPARELGGDFFNYFDLSQGRIALLMGDVSGKGVPAALLMANLQATLRARLPIEPDLARFAGELDGDLESDSGPVSYLTLFLAILDPSRGELRYVNAGHQAPYLIRRDGALEALESTGRPIGLLSGGGYREAKVRVEPGDCMFVHTDGLVDTENEAGEPFGEKRLRAVLSGAAAESPRTLLARVETAVRAHRGHAEAADDAAMLVLQMSAV